MGITQQQKQVAQQRQLAAAQEQNTRIRLIAGPGTGKSHTIEERVGFLLVQGVPASDIFVISFTRATAKDLKERIISHSQQLGRGVAARGVSVSTMHSLALRTLRSANLLRGFPTEPR